MREIKGTPRNLMGLLQNIKYTLHYYQREYRWQRRQIEELLDDLTTEFLRNYKPGHTRDDVANYDIYFMGSIILAGRENAIVDGQQRFSSLTLLLMYLRNRLTKHDGRHPTVEQIIYSEVRGKKSFNINVAERQTCMEAIFKDDLDNFDATNSIESVKNLCERYNDIIELFPKEIGDDILLNFCDWLIEKVYFIEIVAQEEADASKIFITMNDRGLSLTPSEMLKSYLLSEIKNNDRREKLNRLWKKQIDLLKGIDDKGDEIFIRTWLRAQYADVQFVIDENAPSPEINLFENEPQESFKEDFSDFAKIGREFHKWVRDEHKRLNLNTPNDYEQFIEEFDYFVGIYLRIRDAEENFAEDTKYVYYNAKVNLTLQPLLLMAPIRYKDDAATVTQKINLTARFIDLWINARITSGRSLQYNRIQDYSFKIVRDIRGCSIDALKVKLKAHYDALDYHSEFVIPTFGLNKSNKKYVKNILARITSFIEEQTDRHSSYSKYMDAQAEDPFEIEHIICNHFERFKHEFATEDIIGNKFFNREEFDIYRNKIGALLLLRKSINASLKDNDYRNKLEKYCSADGNIYAASLGEGTHRNNPRFKKFAVDNNLFFKPCKKFGKTEIDRRTRLVVQLVNLIWNTEAFND